MKPDNDKSPLPNVTDMSAPARSTSLWQNPWFFIAIAALLLAGWQWFETRQKLIDTQQEISRRLADADLAEKEDQGARKQVLAQVEALQGRLGAIDGKLAEFQGQNANLQAFYQEMARGREEATLLEIEQALTLASQQLQLAGNVPVAILALQTADNRLARLDRPQYLPLRKAVAKDLAQLSAVPFVDVPGLSLRLEQLLLSIDKLPLAAQGRPAAPAEKRSAAEPASWWQQTAGAVWSQLRDLVRIQRFDHDEPILLAPGQSFFLRENLKLRLLNARLALLSHDQTTFRNELNVAQEALARHFIADDKAVQSALAGLRQMAGLEVNADLPKLNDSLAALRAVRPGKEKR